MTLLKRSGFNMIIDTSKNFSPPPITGEALNENSLMKLSNLNNNPNRVSRVFNEKFNQLYNNGKYTFHLKKFAEESFTN